jgi:hypothetical protein
MFRIIISLVVEEKKKEKRKMVSQKKAHTKAKIIKEATLQNQIPLS